MARMRPAAQSWRNAMLASSTHDTKRSEDVRARINVLSEIPAEWYRAIRAWQRLNQDKKIQVAGEAVPSANEEYFLYQTLVGAWPLSPMNSAGYAEFVGRIHGYMEKALREAKVNTSWINPNTEYEAAFHTFSTPSWIARRESLSSTSSRRSRRRSPAPESSTRFPRLC